MIECMFGTTEMREVREAVGRYAAGFDPALVTAADAQRIVDDAVAAENMLATIKALAARRVSETDLWRKEGDASPARRHGGSHGRWPCGCNSCGRSEGAGQRHRICSHFLAVRRRPVPGLAWSGPGLGADERPGAGTPAAEPGQGHRAC